MKKLNSFILNYRGVKEEMEGRDLNRDRDRDRDLNKWNRGNMPLT